jgi:cytochrome c oxidase subunit 1
MSSAITLFFFMGGVFAALVRLELCPLPRSDLLASDTYNKLFTMHGIVMFEFYVCRIPID